MLPWELAGCNTEAESPEQVGVDGNKNDIWHSEDGVEWEQLGTGPSFNSSTPCGEFATQWESTYVHKGALYIAGGNACVYPPEQVHSLKESYKRGEYNYRAAELLVAGGCVEAQADHS